MHRMIRTTVLAVAVTAATAIAGSAQTDAPSTPPSDPQANTPAAPTEFDPKIDKEVLTLRVIPLTKEDLAGTKDKPGLLATWRDAVKAKAAEVTQVQEQAHAARVAKKGAEAERLLEKAEELKTERAELVSRARIVVASLEAKGGDVGEARKYLKAVQASGIETGDVNAYWVAVRRWFTSPEGGLSWAKAIAAFLGILLAFQILARIAGGIVSKALGRFKNTSALLRTFIVNCVRKLVFFVGVVVALSMLGIDIAPFLAAMGAAGFIIGFALQGTLSNFASGVMILLYRPFDIGDFIKVAGVAGSVEAMTLVSTTILTPDNQRVVIPNSSIWGGVITNVTGNETRRVDLVFGIGYDDDIEKASGVLKSVVEAHPLVHKEPAPVIQVHELGDSSVNFAVRPWTNTKDYWKVHWDLTRAVKQRFDEAGISIPFPQRDVHVHEVKLPPETTSTAGA